MSERAVRGAGWRPGSGACSIYRMATHAQVRKIAMALPGVSESTAVNDFGFSVEHKGKQKGFVWLWKERVDPKKPRVPNREVIAVRVPNLAQKDLIIASDRTKFFTEPHYNGFPAVLVRLAAVTVADLRALIPEAWRCLAPKALVAQVDEAPPPKHGRGARKAVAKTARGTRKAAAKTPPGTRKAAAKTAPGTRKAATDARSPRAARPRRG